jgi:arylformamidase
MTIRRIPIDPRLEREYNVRKLRDDFDQVFESWIVRSAAFRKAADAALGCSYDAGEKDKLDLFRCGTVNAPLLMFIHGGYWQRGDRSAYSFAAESFVHNGVDVAVFGYELCPAATMSGIVRKTQQAIIWLWENGRQYGVSPERINVTGFSAGGHLTAMMLATDWLSLNEKVPKDLVRTGCPLSGLYQLVPLLKTTIADALGIDESAAMRLSPHFLAPPAAVPTLVVIGAAETREFHWQTDEFCAKWKTYCPALEKYIEPGVDHFDLINRLASVDSTVFRKVRSLLK